MTNQEDRKILLVFNTCGLKRENPDWYVRCIESFLQQDFKGLHVVVSSCANSTDCFRKIYQTFGKKISYCLYPEKETVQVTFNKTVQEMVEKHGEFEGYMYVDSGVNFERQTNIVSESYKRLKTGKYGIVTVQTDTDAAFNDLVGGHLSDEVVSDHEAMIRNGMGFLYETSFGDVQITGEDYVVPLGGSCNLHVATFSNEYYKSFGNKILADVFRAFCVECAFIWSAKSLKKDWVILKDLQVRHIKSIDGACAGFETHSRETGNYWNNLFCGRSALDFMRDPEAIKCGLGYHNHPNVPPEARMQYSIDAYDEEQKALYPENLCGILNKYFFLTEEEQSYKDIKVRTL